MTNEISLSKRFLMAGCAAATAAVLAAGSVSFAPQAAYADESSSSSSSSASASETAEDDATTADMFRLYNPNSGEHFYTASQEERDALKALGWTDEGIAWVAPLKSEEVSYAPVYRLYSGTDHHYTTSKNEYLWLVQQGWTYEGIGWYSYELADDDESGTTLNSDDQQAVLRTFNPNVDPKAATNNSGSHHYTISSDEVEALVKLGWSDEGIAWYGYVDPSAADDDSSDSDDSSSSSSSSSSAVA